MDNIFEKLEHLYLFASLHGWCKDVDNEIIAIQQDITKENKKPVHSFLEKKLYSSKLAKDGYILTIVLLHKMDYSSFQLSEWLYLNLYEKIYDTDFDFLINHLFNNKHPFSEEITNNLVRRVFFSYRRAINEAFTIKTIVSKVPEEDAVLYIVTILCNRSLSDQNKAIFYFLLSRIDIKLPKNLFEETMKYIFKLSKIIKTIEIKSDAVLAESIDYRDELNEEKIKVQKNNKEIHKNPDMTVKDKIHLVVQQNTEEIQLIEEKIAKKTALPVKKDKKTQSSSILREKEKNNRPDSNHTDTFGNISPLDTGSVITSKDRDLKGIPLGNDNKTIDLTKKDQRPLNYPELTQETAQQKEKIKLDKVPIKEKKIPRNNEEENLPGNSDSFNLTFSKSLEEILSLAEEIANKNNLQNEDSQEEPFPDLNDKETNPPEEEEKKEKTDFLQKKTTTTSNKPKKVQKSSSITNDPEEKINTEKKEEKQDKEDEWTKEVKKEEQEKTKTLESSLLLEPVNSFKDISTPQKNKTTKDIKNKEVKQTNKNRKPIQKKRIKKRNIFILSIMLLIVLALMLVLKLNKSEKQRSEPLPDNEQTVVTTSTEEPITITSTIAPEPIISANNDQGTETDILEPAENEPVITFLNSQTNSPENQLSENIQIFTPDGQEFSFFVNETEILWEINDNNSFWGLYLFLTGPNPPENPRLRAIGNRPWEEYLSDMEQKNPEKELLAIIYTGEIYVIQ